MVKPVVMGIGALLVLVLAGSVVWSRSEENRRMELAPREWITAAEAGGEIGVDWGLKRPPASDIPSISKSEALERASVQESEAPSTRVKLARLERSRYNEHWEGLVWLVIRPPGLDADALPVCESPLDPGGADNVVSTINVVPARARTLSPLGGPYLGGFHARCRIVNEPGWPHRIDYVSWNLIS